MSFSAVSHTGPHAVDITGTDGSARGNKANGPAHVQIPARPAFANVILGPTKFKTRHARRRSRSPGSHEAAARVTWRRQAPLQTRSSAGQQTLEQEGTIRSPGRKQDPASCSCPGGFGILRRKRKSSRIVGMTTSTHSRRLERVLSGQRTVLEMQDIVAQPGAGGAVCDPLCHESSPA